MILKCVYLVFHCGGKTFHFESTCEIVHISIIIVSFQSNNRKLKLICDFQVLDILNYIKEEFKTRLPAVEWMDETTMKEAQHKVVAILNKIGFPDLINNVTALDEKYALVSIMRHVLFVPLFTKKALMT